MTCNVCGDNTPYTDWPRCELCGPTLAVAGQEYTRDQKVRRAKWERHMAEIVRMRGYPALARAHERTAQAYEEILDRS